MKLFLEDFEELGAEDLLMLNGGYKATSSKKTSSGSKGSTPSKNSAPHKNTKPSTYGAGGNTYTPVKKQESKPYGGSFVPSKMN